MFCVPAEIQPKDKELDPPLLYWILNCTSAKYFTKPLSKLLTSILSAIKTGLYIYSNTSYSRGAVNQK
jgi:hypothetical protein